MKKIIEKKFSTELLSFLVNGGFKFTCKNGKIQILCDAVDEILISDFE